MTFENGFDPREHFEPIIACLKKNPSLKESILSLIDLYINSSNWPFSVEELFDSIRDMMNDNWAYSCFRQFFLYDESRADEIWDEKIPRTKDIKMEPEYKKFFVLLQDTYVPQVLRAWSAKYKT